MKRSTKLFRAFVGMGALVSLVIPAVPAGASTVPFRDASANGTLTLCNQKGQAVTTGSLDDIPFVWSAVSSTPSPAGYTRAYLNVYQPIQYVDPSDWSGNELTTVAIYSNPRHPIAQATYADVPLLFTYNSYPPRWNGLYELRMYFASPNKPVYSWSYPAAVIRVSNNRWSLVSGGGTACNVGTAISIASLRLPKSQTETPQSLVIGSKAALNQSTTTLDTFPRESGLPSSRSKVAAGAVGGGKGGGLSGGLIAVIVIGTLFLAGTASGTVIRRRRRASRSPTAND